MGNILKYPSQINIVLTIVLIISLNTLPRRIKKSIENNSVKKDTVLVEKTVTANIEARSNFIYFDGMITGKCFKMSENFSYDARFPEAIFDGYLNPVVSNNNGEYYIWSRSQVTDNTTLISLNRIKGWFVTDGHNFQSITDSNKYYQILYPIVEKQ